ncbi:oligo-1,6-glucosidase [Weissella uvarum]|uniref:glycoside hydrolase family 13 protein n=1 Tax=Weissella uvarum TaxID=1479233 RepID=UPI001961127B|nr:alpha-glucosidase [Weissella uvarum]MBM7616582.1 oligo-1,6-glucosidase [Weissella uvarum]MCM0594959.1 alpha-glucosidase [Weissella uvarum]
MKSTWFKDSVVYQIYPQSFQDSNHDGVGDLKGIQSRLDYLNKLGVDVVWLNPIYTSPNQDNGYDIADYRSIQSRYGSMDDFDELLADMHEHDLKLIMDLVVNHTSDQHHWFQESKKSKDNPYADYYIWRDPVDGHEPNNWGSFFSGPAWTYVPERGQYYLHLFADGQPDLNWENEKVREEVYDLMRFWLDKGVDGFRMDVINLISKPAGLPDAPQAPDAPYGNVEQAVANGPRVNEFLQEMNREVLSKYDIMTVGECAGTTPDEAMHYANLDDTELNMIFQFEHVNLSPNENPALTKWNDEPIDLVELKQVFSRWQTELDGKAWNSLYWNNHDQPRAVSRFGNDTPEYRELAAKMLGTILHMMQGTPYVYEGEELGMTNVHFKQLSDYEDLESINAYHQFVDEEQLVDSQTMLNYLEDRSRDNARTPMQWDDSTHAGFTDATPWYGVNPNYTDINAKAALADDESVFYYYQKLIQLRHDSELIRYGSYRLLDGDNPDVYAYEREYNGQKLVVLGNFTDQTLVYGAVEQTQGKLLIGNYDDDQGETLRPYEAKVYLVDAE